MARYTLKDYRELGEGRAGLSALRRRYPEIWAQVERDLAAVAAGGPADLHAAYMKDFEFHRDRVERSGGSRMVVDTSFPALARARMLVLALEMAQTAAQARGDKPRLKLGTFTGTLLQKLLFAEALERKPAKAWLLRLLWPLLPDRRLLMPLVQKKGIWCFYSTGLLRSLARLVGGRSCLEVGAGDGTLARFLRRTGVELNATDDHSWSRLVDFPPEVERLSAEASLLKYRPRVVLCSWPPPGNGFEAAVFACSSVESYIVLGSSVEGVTGNREAYRGQEAFSLRSDRRLAALLLPPDRGHEVLVFTRRAGGGGGG